MSHEHARPRPKNLSDVGEADWAEAVRLTVRPRPLTPDHVALLRRVRAALDRRGPPWSEVEAAIRERARRQDRFGPERPPHPPTPALDEQIVEAEVAVGEALVAEQGARDAELVARADILARLRQTGRPPSEGELAHLRDVTQQHADAREWVKRRRGGLLNLERRRDAARRAARLEQAISRRNGDGKQ